LIRKQPLLVQEIFRDMKAAQFQVSARMDSTSVSDFNHEHFMKSSFKNILFTACLTLIMLLSACTGNFDETNTNPNQPGNVPTAYLFTYAQETLLDRLYDGFDNSRVGMTLAQYWSQNQYTEESRYQYRPATNNTTWNAFYTGLFNLQEIIRLNEANEIDPSINEVAVARIMKAWAFQFLTDVYGDIPYTDALQAPDGKSSPAYTPQSEIYPDLLQELQEARDQIDVNQPGFGDADLIYGGDMEKWRRFANSLILRVAIRMSDRMEAEALAAIEDAEASGVFETNDDNASIKYLMSQPSTNPLYVDVVVANRIDFSSSNILVDQLLDLDDPRINAYFEPAVESGEFVGRPFGQNAAAANALNPNAVSQLSEKVLSPDFPGMLMDLAEVNFILAEAAQRGATLSMTPAEYYAEGIRASMEYWDVATPGEIDAYIAAHPYDAANYKQSIGVQKWIALYMQGFQGWIEYRRLDFTGVLGFPVDGPLVDIEEIPLRRVYPPDEQTLNRSNYVTAVTAMGSDDLVTPVWWDVN
jgi:hypothetical protein